MHLQGQEKPVMTRKKSSQGFALMGKQAAKTAVSHLDKQKAVR